MPNAIKIYVKSVDTASRIIGFVAMYMVFAMMGILLFSSISRTVFNTPHIWAVEMAQFTMAAYYMLGGALSMLLGAHVRMDVFYCKWSPKRKAVTDAFTIFCLLFYLIVLLAGGISSTAYSLEYDQRNYSAWAPPVAPIKLIMVSGIIMMLLQTVSTFFKNLARIKGVKL